MDIPVFTDQQKLIHQLCVNTGCRLEDLARVIVILLELHIDLWQTRQ